MLQNGKERTIKDLSLYINNKLDNRQSLYCMLLGAGASKSSGIRTGQELVAEWRDLFLKQIDDINVDEIKDISEKQKYLEENFDWYKKNIEYSCFFEQLYDLPRQRSNFIEKEVAEKIPSIGYHYLNHLTEEHGKIGTFFTTNFDDLLEQSFHDIKRPIVCPYDSSVKNLSITSNRTKIIKLHGDFLYTTLAIENEIQNLTINMKNKFQEFLKNYGLIVVGYAGNDDSIMNSLEELLNLDEYLNYGLYWCILKKDLENDNISKRVKKLLEHKKVFYVLIDNFDAFCAELTHYVLSEDIVELEAEKKLENQREYYTKQKELYVNNPFIKKDIDEWFSRSYYALEKTDSFQTNKDKEIETNFKKNLREEGKSPEEEDILNLIKNKNYNKALEIIEKNLNAENVPSYLYNKFARLKIQCLIENKEKEKALKIINETISYNDKIKKDSNIQLYLDKLEVMPNPIEKIEVLNEAINIDDTDPILLNILANEKTKLLKVNNNLYDEIINHYNKSISLNMTASNDSYLDKLNFLIKYAKKDRNSVILNACNQILQDLEQKDYFSIVVYDAKLEKIYREYKTDKDNKENYLTQIATLFDEYCFKNKIYERNEVYLNGYITMYERLKENKGLLNIFKKYDCNNRDNIMYYIKKANIYLSNFSDLASAIKILENIDKRLLKIQRKNRFKYFFTYLRFLSFDKQYKKIIDIVNNEPDSKILSEISAYEEALFVEDKNKFFDLIFKIFEDSEKTTDDYIQYTYNLLKLEEYDWIYSECKKLFSNQQKYPNVDVNNNVLRINYNLAKKNIDKKITERNLEFILKQEEDSTEKAAAYVLLDKIEDAKKIIKKEIDEDYEDFYYLQKMPIFSKINFNEYKQEKYDYEGIRI